MTPYQDKRQQALYYHALKSGNPLEQAIMEFADVLAEETLANEITLNGAKIYGKE
jgi:hypothetical protein